MSETEIAALERRVEGQAGDLAVKDSGPLAALEQAYTLLEKADAPENVKELADKAEALRQYARRARLSHEAQNRCAELKLRATRKLGQMLDAMEKSKGAAEQGWKERGDESSPRLEDVGVSKKQSSRAQVIGRMPEEEFEAYIEQTAEKDGDLTISELESTARKLEKKAKKNAEREAAARAMQGIEIPDRLQLIHGDFRDVLSEQPEASVDLVLTDPPYHEGFLPLWSDLAHLSASVLKPGGFLLAYSGQRFLPEVLSMVGEHMEYFWTVSVEHTHGQLRFWDRRCWNSWKPLLMWRKPGGSSEELEWFRDKLDQGDSSTKEYHEWAQPLAQAAKMVEKFSPVGGLVLDPMSGSATIPLAALFNERKAVGVEEDKEHYDAALQRVQKALSDGIEAA